jgi:hypothetical protein
VRKKVGSYLGHTDHGSKVATKALIMVDRAFSVLKLELRALYSRGA